MAVDFRSLLKENMRIQETGERWFDDIEIGGVFYLSIQASTLHASTPSELLEDVSAYEAFQITLQTKQGVFICGKKGAWDYLAHHEWFELFQTDTPIIREAENVPAALVQKIYEDMVACTEEHPDMVIKKKGVLLM